MDVGSGLAGLICVAVAIGHETVGLVWALPRLTEAERVPSTRLGPPSLTEDMLRVTWHIVTIFVLALGGLLLTLALDETADPKKMMLRWFAGMWVAATVMAAGVSRRHPRLHPLLVVPLLWVVVAVLCWKASI